MKKTVNFLAVLSLLLGLTACAKTSTSETQTTTYRKQPDVQIIKLGSSLRIILSSDGCFEPQTTAIRPTCKPTLNKIADLLNEYGNAPINVAGYTDTVRDLRAAQLFSQQQADSIVAYLWTRGNAHGRFHVMGYGPKYPIATNLNPDDSYYNRRIEITVRY